MRIHGSAIIAILLTVGLIACAEQYEDPDAIVRDTIIVDTADGLSGDNLVATLQADGRFSTLVTAIDSSGLRSTFEGPGPFTLFAPTDEAFAGLDEGTVDGILQPANRDQLRDLLMHHVVNGTRMRSDLRGVQSIESMYGDDLRLQEDDRSLRVSDANVVEPDINASNGVVHAIDSVLMPADPS